VEDEESGYQIRCQRNVLFSFLHAHVDPQAVRETAVCEEAQGYHSCFPQGSRNTGLVSGAQDSIELHHHVDFNLCLF
jgi:hypothetical protein